MCILLVLLLSFPRRNSAREEGSRVFGLYEKLLRKRVFLFHSEYHPLEVLKIVVLQAKQLPYSSDWPCLLTGSLWPLSFLTI